MKVTKFMTGAVLALASTAFAFAEGATITNTVSTDTYYFEEAKNQETDRVGDLKDEVEAKYESEMFDFGVKAGFTFDNNGQDETLTTRKDTWTRFSLNDADWYVRYRPFSFMQVHLSDDVYAKGSTLKSWDIDYDLARIGTGILSADFYPINGLTISVGLWNNTRFFDTNENADLPAINLAASYEMEGLGTASITFGNVLNKTRTLGLYAQVTAVENLELDTGLSFDLSEADSIELLKNETTAFNKLYYYPLKGKTLLTLGATYTGVENLSVTADMAMALGSKVETAEEMDLFIGAKVSYDISEALSAGLKFNVQSDVFHATDSTADDNSPILTFNPEASFKYGKSTFTAGVLFSTYTLNDTAHTAFYLPLSWKYEF